MTGDSSGAGQLRCLEGQRARLADRVRAPWWYLVGYPLMWVVLIGSPFAAHFLRFGSLVLVVALALAYLLEWGFGRTTGVALRTNRTMDRYPETRPAGIAILIVAGLAVVAEFLLVGNGRLTVAAVIGAVSVPVILGCQLAVFRGIRRDLRGRVGSG